MSKLSFRARQLDATKPMAVYKGDEIPELPDFAAINRAVPQMPTGMEKEEETEHHLQRALSAQQVYGTAEALTIPVPEINDVEVLYRKVYCMPDCTNYKPPKQYIHVQPWGMDQEIPDYDMDSEDEAWLNKQKKKLDVTPLKFETMMDRLEKGSGQTVMTLQEAKALLKEDDDLIIAVYDYWLNKRLRLQHPLIPSVRTEKRDGSTTNNPYVAFRRRTEKMQTRKNRKNDEASYERMLKLRRDLSKALTILELMKRREKSKKEMLKLTIEVSEKRYQMQDWDGKAYGEALAKRHTLPPTYIQPLIQQFSSWGQRDEPAYTKKSKREYKKRRHKAPAAASTSRETSVQLPQYNDVDILGQPDIYSSEEEVLSPQLSASDHEADDDPDGNYAFRRKPGVLYNAPINNGLGNWPWHGPDEGGFGEAKYRYSLTTLSQPRGCVGFARRRLGRGGRAIIDRAQTDHDDYLEQVDFTPDATETGWGQTYRNYVHTNKIPCFRPKTPPTEDIPIPGLFGSECISPALSLEFNVESYQNHQEQLLQMQRQQQLQQDTLELGSHLGSAGALGGGGGGGGGQSRGMDPVAGGSSSSCDLGGQRSSLGNGGGNSSSAPATNCQFTLDSASAAFAASAVRNSASELIARSSTTATITTVQCTSVSVPQLVPGGSGATTPQLQAAAGGGGEPSSHALPRVMASPALPSSVMSASILDVAGRAGSPAVKTPTSAGLLPQNGPLDAKSDVFSTLPAADVLQLNYSLTSTTTSGQLPPPPSAPPAMINTNQHHKVASAPSLSSSTITPIAGNTIGSEVVIGSNVVVGNATLGSAVGGNHVALMGNTIGSNMVLGSNVVVATGNTIGRNVMVGNASTGLLSSIASQSLLQSTIAPQLPGQSVIITTMSPSSASQSLVVPGIATKCLTPAAPPTVFKLASTPSVVRSETLPKENHESANSLLPEQVIPMEVT